MKKVLHLASWYPNKTSVQEGDFIQRHLQAISLFQPTEVIYIVKDVQNIPCGKKTEINQNGALRETIVYYHPVQSGIPVIDKLISNFAYLHIYKTEIKKYIERNGNPDLIHVHVAMRAGLAALWLKRKYKIPFIVTEHWCGYIEKDVKGLYHEAKKLMPVTKYILKKSKAILPVSEDLRMSIKKIVKHQKNYIIPNVVNEIFFNYSPFFEQQKFKILHVSSMNYFKNAEGLFSAFDKFIQLYDDAELVCLGPLCKSLENWIEINISEKGKTRIIFKGVTAYEKVAEYMKQSDVLVINSLFETFSCVAAEALLCGLPVISTPVGILPEIITDKNGMLVNNENELYAAIEKMYLTRNSKYNRLFIAGQYKGNFSYLKIGDQICKLYESVLAV